MFSIIDFVLEKTPSETIIKSTRSFVLSEKLIKSFLLSSNAPLILSTIPISNLNFDSSLSSNLTQRECIEEINTFIFSEARGNNNVQIFDFNKWANEIGKEFYDQKMEVNCDK